MNIERLTKILQAVSDGGLSVDEGLKRLTTLPFEDIAFAHIDHHRSLRKGFPEVIFGQGKSAGQIVAIMGKMTTQENVVLVTRVGEEKARTVIERFPDARYHEQARLIAWVDGPIPARGKGSVLVLSAGTSDIPVAEEAALTARYMGNRVETIYDVGVSGIHRLLEHKPAIDAASVIVVVAGMEGALPSVVAGLVARPVIAVPSSVGYGVSFGGLTALFAMLNSCSSNVAVVNIDNGFGAGYMASMINRA